MRRVRLGRDDLTELRTEFARRNAGYDLDWITGADSVAATDTTRFVFIQRGRANADCGGQQSELTTGDVVVVRPGTTVSFASTLDVLWFSVPAAPPLELATFLRADADVGDTPGGCATASDAYRRLLVTWQQYRGLNAHRVLMLDSLSHFHPIDTGFDELYLVQGTRPGARVLTSTSVERIIDNDTIVEGEVGALLVSTPVEVGDLLWAARGEMHRAVGGVLAHVIAVPGFIPGQEIGVDDALRAINDRLGLAGERALPVHG